MYEVSLSYPRGKAKLLNLFKKSAEKNSKNIFYFFSYLFDKSGSNMDSKLYILDRIVSIEYELFFKIINQNFLGLETDS